MAGGVRFYAFQSISSRFLFGKFCERQACVHKQSEQDASAKREALGCEASKNESAKHEAQGSEATENASA